MSIEREGRERGEGGGGGGGACLISDGKEFHKLMCREKKLLERVSLKPTTDGTDKLISSLGSCV